MTDFSQEITLIRAAVRYRMATGMRTALRLWGSLIVAVAVARGLEIRFPVQQWADQWIRARWLARLGTTTGLLASLMIGLAPLLSIAMRRWGQQHLLTLPLSATQRFRIDSLTILLFMAPPSLALLGVAQLGIGHGSELLSDVRSVVTLACALAILPALQSLLLDRSIPALNVVQIGLILLAGFAPLSSGASVGAMIVIGILTAATIRSASRSAGPADMTPQAASIVPTESKPDATVVPVRVPAYASGLLLRELLWFTRTAGTRILTAVLAGWLAAGCVVLAVRNNGVSTISGMQRLSGFFMSLGLAFLVIEVIRTRDQNRSVRVLDATLPVPATHELLALAFTLLLFATIADLGLIITWIAALTPRPPLPIILLECTRPLFVALAALFLGESESLKKRGSGGGAIFWLCAAFALAAAVSPAVAFVAVLCIVPALVFAAMHTIRHADFPVTPAEAA